MRFIPLKTDPDKEEQLVTILVRIADIQKGTPDNIQELKLPIITKLELEGETFILNQVKLINTIFIPSKVDSLPKQLEKYAIFMTNQVRTDFIINQQSAREEFLKYFKIKDNGCL